MADPRFYTNKGPFTLAQLAEMSGARLENCDDPGIEISDVNGLEAAGPGDLAFFENRKYKDALGQSTAGACFMMEEFVEFAPKSMAVLVCPRPRRNYARAARAFYPESDLAPGIDPAASVDPTADVSAAARIEAMAVVGANAVIGDNVVISSGAQIGRGVTIAANSVVGANSTITHAVIGQRVVIYPGVRIGQPGFGFDHDEEGIVKIPHLGRVIVEDDVEIGANTTVDRGSSRDTVIGQATMVDNLVQIAHNVVIGKGCILVSQSGISGSTTLGNFVVLGGKTGVAGHINLGDGVQVAGGGLVAKGLPPGTKAGGFPAVPINEWRWQSAVLGKIGRERIKIGDLGK